LKKKISLILKHENFIKDFVLIKDGKQGLIRIYLRYAKTGEPMIEGLQRISKPGRRVYTTADSVPRVVGGMGIAIISTPMGVLTDKVARKYSVGGEVLCYVW
jgi:small subunit ribosomal protein S8